MAVLAERFLEQMVGVAAVSDLIIFWVLLALFAAMPAAAGESQTAPLPEQESPQGRRTSRISSGSRLSVSGVQTVLPAAMAICLIAGVGVLTWTKSINYLEAGFNAREGFNRIRDADFQNALVSVDRAIDLAPDVSVYHTLRGAVYSGYQKQDDGPREPDCAHLAEFAPYQACLTHKVYLNNLEAARQRPFDWRPRLNLADSTLTLALLEQDSNLAGESVRLYREVAQLDPQSWWHWELLAAAHIQTGQPEAALEPLEKSLAILDGIPRSAISRLLQGIAFSELREPATALRSFNEAIRLDPKLAEAYTNRGGSYNGLGQYQSAIQDLDEAIKLDPELAMAYNNRGNSYGNLDQLQRAIEDYDEAIRLNPQLALAYSNRALANTYLGRDESARLDVEMVAQLGLDLGPILAEIEAVKTSR